MTSLDIYVLVFLPIMFLLMIGVPLILVWNASKRSRRRATYAASHSINAWHATARPSVL